VTPGTWKALVSVEAPNGRLRLPMGGNQTYSLAGGSAQPPHRLLIDHAYVVARWHMQTA
jgi:hypothetical protein